MIPAALALVLLSGCAAGDPALEDPTAELGKVSIEGFEQVKAELDYETGTAITPISKYIIGWDFKLDLLARQAMTTQVAECMGTAGYEFDVYSSTNWEALRPPEDRLYGQWDKASAAKFGFELDPSREGSSVDPRKLLDQDGLNALSACNAKLSEDKTLAPLLDELTATNIAERIHGNAARAAQGSQAGKKATEQFHACLKDRGILVDPESGYVASSAYEDAGKKALIAAAVAEVDCNISTGRIETLYDLQSRYESAYMKKYEAQLGEVLEVKQNLTKKLQAFIDGDS